MGLHWSRLRGFLLFYLLNTGIVETAGCFIILLNGSVSCFKALPPQQTSPKVSVLLTIKVCNNWSSVLLILKMRSFLRQHEQGFVLFIEK